MGKKQKIHRLLDYYMRHEQLEKSLKLVKKHKAAI
jgi:hypothetical protein